MTPLCHSEDWQAYLRQDQAGAGGLVYHSVQAKAAKLMIPVVIILVVWPLYLISAITIV